MYSFYRESGVEPLIRSLERHWKEFIRSISSNLKDYLSLEHLGLILKNLSRRCENFTISYIYCSYFYRELGVEPLIRSLEGHWKEFIRSIGASRTDLEELVQKM